jgi:hypothetical protein
MILNLGSRRKSVASFKPRPLYSKKRGPSTNLDTLEKRNPLLHYKTHLEVCAVCASSTKHAGLNILKLYEGKWENRLLDKCLINPPQSAKMHPCWIDETAFIITS